ncbi:hypothetical protein B0H10DRAFT_2223898 [Mycena sp. CBHHK59/15]|nr:hypothetical protein B0H10DRAFT_2443050 [Mycena sp. CBHHK59/15]KAJ6611611.1 hypothetical protein B0H10DRAFT_2223898 [Mycena sp. CBHHK59/15]
MDSRLDHFAVDFWSRASFLLPNPFCCPNLDVLGPSSNRNNTHLFVAVRRRTRIFEGGRKEGGIQVSGSQVRDFSSCNGPNPLVAASGDTRGITRCACFVVVAAVDVADNSAVAATTQNPPITESRMPPCTSPSAAELVVVTAVDAGDDGEVDASAVCKVWYQGHRDIN